MAANVTVDARAYSDPRFERLGALAGYNQYEALGRMVRVWGWCTDREVDVISACDLAIFLAVATDVAATVLVESGLGSLAEGGVRVKGCRGRTEWLSKLRVGGKKGGRARAGSAKRVNGRFAANVPNPHQTKPGDSLVNDQTVTKPSPGLTSPLTPTPTITLTPTKKKSREAKEGPYPRCVAYYFERYLGQSSGRKPRWGSREGKNLKDLLASHGEGEVIARMEFMFDGHSWLKGPFTMGSLVTNWDALIPASGPKKTVSGDDLRTMAAQLKAKGE